MRGRVKEAFEEGLLLGLRYGIASLIILVLSGWVVHDYLTSRVRAYNGQLAFEFIQQVQEQVKKQEAKKPVEGTK